MLKQRLVMSVLTLAVLMAACSPTAPTQVPSGTQTLPESDLVIYSGRSEALIQPIIEQFEAAYPQIHVVLKAGSNSELANALLEERNNPQADIFLTTEFVTVQKMANEGALQAYQPAEAGIVPADHHHPDWLWTALTLRARVIIYNTDLVSEAEAPRSIFDLTDPKWSGQVAAAGSTNGGMQGQVSAMRQLFGEEQTEAWLQGLLDNQVTFFGGHTDVRKAVGAGEFKIGLVNHYYYHLQKAEGSPVAVVYPDQGEGQPGLFVNATAVGVVKGARHAQAAQAFIDFLLSPQGQKLFAELNYEYPIRTDVPLHPDVQPLANYRLAKFDFVKAASDLDTTLTLLEKVGMP